MIKCWAGVAEVRQTVQPTMDPRIVKECALNVSSQKLKMNFIMYSDVHFVLIRYAHGYRNIVKYTHRHPDLKWMINKSTEFSELYEAYYGKCEMKNCKLWFDCVILYTLTCLILYVRWSFLVIFLVFLPVRILNLYSAGIDFSRQNLTSVDVRFWQLKSIPAL